MEDGNAEAAVGVDVWVVEGVVELEGWGLVGVVGGEGHAGFEVAAVVEGVGVDDNKGDVPEEHVFVVKLWLLSTR